MSKLLAIAAAVALAAGGCGGVQQRFPADVQASLAEHALRRLETARFIIYYPAPRRAEVERFIARAGRCADAVRDAAVLHRGAWGDKMVVVMPEVAFNNAFVMAPEQGYDEVSVIPTMATLDFATEFGLLPDPGYIACHELVHYAQFQQVAGFWRVIDAVFGALYTPQLGYDPWFLEGLATHYEAELSPGVGRPAWPVFTGMFAAAYAGHRVTGADLSEYGRLASVGHHYLVGAMFLRFLTERYGERQVWTAIADTATSLTGWLFPSSLRRGFGVSFTELIAQFDAWHAQVFPVRQRPAGQRSLVATGNDARYARGRDGTEAWIADDVDVASHLVVRAPDGAILTDLSLVDAVPPRALVQAEPLLVSGLSVTADGREVWLTAIDRAAIYQVPRLMRWRRGETQLTELGHELGPGATIDPAGAVYYYCAVDGDRWSLAAWDVQSGRRRTLIDMAPGTYVLGAQISADGARLVASVWDGTAFVAWVIDAATGAKLAELRGPGTPVWDPSFTDDGRVMYLGVVDGRFQLMIDGRAVTDAPYAVLAARSARGTIRFLNREGWQWTLDEIAAPPPPEPAASPEPAEIAPPALPVAAAVPSTIASDEPYSVWDHFFYPQLRAPVIIEASSGGGGLLHFGAVIGGGDRLGTQGYRLAGFAEPRDGITRHVHWGGEADYLNTMLAPWQILASAGFIDWIDPVATTDPDRTLGEERRTRDASLAVSRVWRDTLTATVAGIFTEDTDIRPDEPGMRRRLGGPAVQLDWVSGESTRYTGLRRAIYLDGYAAYLPRALSSFAGDIYDVRGRIAATVPLPLGRRHTITAALRGRAVVGREDTGLLQLGGISDLSILASGTSSDGPPRDFDDRRIPPNHRFVELLRGYEDYAIPTDRAVIADLRWDYPLIIDRGYAATFGVLPASFVRELDLELFGAGAADRAGDLHAAAGAMLSLRIVVLRFPLVVSYQLARRLRDDDAVTQLIGVAADL